MPIRGAVYVNGRITPAGDAVIPVYDHGFLYGEGVYETLRTYDRVPFLYDRHVRRLRASAAHLGCSTCRSATRRCSAGSTIRSRPPARCDEAYIRVLLTRGVGELTYDVRRHPGPVTGDHRQAARGAAGARPRPTASASRSCRSCAIIPGSVNPIIKSNNLLNNALAMQEANRRGAEEG